ncbi:MAG: 30S ribosomal protein S3, partial [Candidatus Nanopelagicales bacterium]
GVKVWIYKGEALGTRAEREAAAAAARLSGQRARPERPRRARGEGDAAVETTEVVAEAASGDAVVEVAVATSEGQEG